jgi:hypothetical protein
LLVFASSLHNKIIRIHDSNPGPARAGVFYFLEKKCTF